MYALIQNNTIRQVGALPKLWYDGTRWHDLRDDRIKPLGREILDH